MYLKLSSCGFTSSSITRKFQYRQSDHPPTELVFYKIAEISDNRLSIAFYETNTFTDINWELINFRHVHVKVLVLVHVPVFTIEIQYNNLVNKEI